MEEGVPRVACDHSVRGPNEAVSARSLTAQGTVRVRRVPPVSAERL